MDHWLFIKDIANNRASTNFTVGGGLSLTSKESKCSISHNNEIHEACSTQP